jgi:hypothetical protein
MVVVVCSLGARAQDQQDVDVIPEAAGVGAREAGGAPFEAVPAEAAEVEAAAVEAAHRDARVLGWVLQQGLEALAAPVHGPGGIMPDRQRQNQIEQQAQQMERFFQPVLASELEMIRQACGSLDRVARRKLLAAGQAAVKQTAKQFATRQLTGGLGQDDFDYRDSLRQPLTKLLAELAPPSEYAAYEREQATRSGRRAAAARVLIVTKLDRQLDLTSEQRRGIEADLERHWDANWLRVLSEHAGLINGHPLAPDYATACIQPHLRPEQAAVWRDWCQAAGTRLVGSHVGFNLDNQGIQSIDPWWGEAE